MYCMRICTLVHTSNKQVCIQNQTNWYKLCIQNQTNWYKLNNTQHEAHYSSGKIISQHFSSPIRLDPSAAYGHFTAYDKLLRYGVKPASWLQRLPLSISWMIIHKKIEDVYVIICIYIYMCMFTDTEIYCMICKPYTWNSKPPASFGALEMPQRKLDEYFTNKQGSNSCWGKTKIV